MFKYTVFSSGSFCKIYRATDEALLAKTAVWPNFFFMIFFFALKRSKLFIIIQYPQDPDIPYIYSLYKKKRKHNIIFNNLRTFKDEHFKLTGDLDWHVPYQKDEFHNFSGTITSCFPSSCKGTHEAKSHKNSM